MPVQDILMCGGCAMELKIRNYTSMTRGHGMQIINWEALSIGKTGMQLHILIMYLHGFYVHNGS